MKKDSFLKGTIVASIAIIISKILGVLYVIPFYKIIGENGGVLYSYAYNIYNLFLNISTAGIPIALSLIISEYIALGMFDAKERTFKTGKKIILSFSKWVIFILYFSLIWFIILVCPVPIYPIFYNASAFVLELIIISLS